MFNKCHGCAVCLNWGGFLNGKLHGESEFLSLSLCNNQAKFGNDVYTNHLELQLRWQRGESKPRL